MIEYKGYEIYDKLKITRNNSSISLLDNNSSLGDTPSWSILLEFYIYSNGDIIRSIDRSWGSGDFKIYYNDNILTIQENTSGDKYEINNIEMNKKIRLYYNYDYNLDSSILKINNILYQHTLNNKSKPHDFLLQKAIYKYIVFNNYNRNIETEFIPARDNSRPPGFLINNSTYSIAVSSSSDAVVLDADDQEKLEEIIDGSVRVLYNEGVENLRPYVLQNQQNLTFVNLPYCNNYGECSFYNCSNLKELNLSNSWVDRASFSNCNNLISLNLYNSTLNYGSFSGLDSLEQINIDNIKINYALTLNNKPSYSSFYNFFVNTKINELNIDWAGCLPSIKNMSQLQNLYITNIGELNDDKAPQYIITENLSELKNVYLDFSDQHRKSGPGISYGDEPRRLFDNCNIPKIEKIELPNYYGTHDCDFIIFRNTNIHSLKDFIVPNMKILDTNFLSSRNDNTKLNIYSNNIEKIIFYNNFYNVDIYTSWNNLNELDFKCKNLNLDLYKNNINFYNIKTLSLNNGNFISNDIDNIWEQIYTNLNDFTIRDLVSIENDYMNFYNGKNITFYNYFPPQNITLTKIEYINIARWTWQNIHQINFLGCYNLKKISLSDIRMNLSNSNYIIPENIDEIKISTMNIESNYRLKCNTLYYGWHVNGYDINIDAEKIDAYEDSYYYYQNIHNFIASNTKYITTNAKSGFFNSITTDTIDLSNVKNVSGNLCYQFHANNVYFNSLEGNFSPRVFFGAYSRIDNLYLKNISNLIGFPNGYFIYINNLILLSNNNIVNTDLNLLSQNIIKNIYVQQSMYNEYINTYPWSNFVTRIYNIGE